MELRTTREMRRNQRLDKAMAKQEKTLTASGQPQQARCQGGDKLTLSQQALSYLEEQSRLAWEREQRRDRASDSLSALDTAKSQLDSMAEKLKVMRKCQKIAASVMRGDRVPPEDLAYLMKNDPEGYKLAMAMRRENPDPEDCESVLDEEDRRGNTQAVSGESCSGGGEPSAPADCGESG